MTDAEGQGSSGLLKSRDKHWLPEQGAQLLPANAWPAECEELKVIQLRIAECRCPSSISVAGYGFGLTLRATVDLLDGPGPHQARPQCRQNAGPPSLLRTRCLLHLGVLTVLRLLGSIQPLPKLLENDHPSFRMLPARQRIA